MWQRRREEELCILSSWIKDIKKNTKIGSGIHMQRLAVFGNLSWFLLSLFQLHLQDSEGCNNFDVILGNRDTVHINGRYRGTDALTKHFLHLPWWKGYTSPKKSVYWGVILSFCLCILGVPRRVCITLGARSGNLPRRVEQKTRLKTENKWTNFSSTNVMNLHKTYIFSLFNFSPPHLMRAVQA